jgi:hypothetical protein
VEVDAWEAANAAQARDVRSRFDAKTAKDA